MHDRPASPETPDALGEASRAELALEEGIVLTEGWYGLESIEGRRGRWTRPRFAWRAPPKPIARFVLSYRLPSEARVDGIEGVLEQGDVELARFSLQPGSHRLNLELPEPATGGDFVVRLERGWIPAEAGLGLDARELGVLVFSLDAPPAGGKAAVPAGTPSGSPAPESSSADHSLEFEERFRGTRELIRDRQRRYVRYFAACWNVLDIGCGRGEFLELLREIGSDGWGVDASPRAVALCVSRGLRAVQGDAISHLARVGEGTLDGLFCAQLIEHLSRGDLLRLLALTLRKLRPGARALFETVNPGCLSVFSDSFYVDPGHVRPVPRELLSFDLETAGFEVLEVLFGSPVEEERRLPQLPATGSAPMDAALENWRNRLNSLLYSDRDYAVLVRRPE